MLSRLSSCYWIGNEVGAVKVRCKPDEGMGNVQDASSTELGYYF